MILISGAAGKTGKSIIQSLVGKGQPIRAFVRKESQIKAMTHLGVEDCIVGDMRVKNDFLMATKGIEKIYHICPNVNEFEIEIGENMINAAKQNGVERIVYHSVLHSQVEAMPHHWLKMRVEEKIIQSGLPYTILQPTAYMQNILNSFKRIKENGVYEVPYDIYSNNNLVDLLDVAEIASKVIIETGHFGATYELVGTCNINPIEIAAELAIQMNIAVRAEKFNLKDWKESAEKSGLATYSIDALLKMFSYYEKFNFQGSRKVLEFLLGRKPTSFSTFLERELTEK